jgi:hypothetical protein
LGIVQGKRFKDRGPEDPGEYKGKNKDGFPGQNQEQEIVPWGFFRGDCVQRIDF